MVKHQRALVVGVLVATLFVASAAVATAQTLHDSPGGGVVLEKDPASGIVAGVQVCARGICGAAATHRLVAYQGGAGAQHRDVADYEGKSWDPKSCAAATPTAADCGYGGLEHWRSTSPTTDVEPGVQVYGDPNPDAAPAGPYPLPALAVTACGIYVGGGALPFPAGAFTNDAGQIALETPC